MKRPEHILERCHFTSTGALAREIQAWLEFSPCKVIVHVNTGRQQEELFNEMGDYKVMGRVVVKQVEPF